MDAPPGSVVADKTLVAYPGHQIVSLDVANKALFSGALIFSHDRIVDVPHIRALRWVCLTTSALNMIPLLLFIFLFILEIATAAERFILNIGLTFDGDLSTLKDKSTSDLATVGDRFLAAFADGFKLFNAMRHQ